MAIEVNQATHVQAVSINALEGGESQTVAMSVSNNETTALSVPYVMVTVTADCFFRRGLAPVAVSDGTDQILLANNSYRISGLEEGDKLSFIMASGTGTAYVTPGG